MVVPSYRQRVGRIEIQNKERKAKEKVIEKKEEPISEEEHKKRLGKLKEMGLLK